MKVSLFWFYFVQIIFIFASPKCGCLLFKQISIIKNLYANNFTISTKRKGPYY